MKRVLILCTGNSCRSQMAEGLFRHLSKSTYNAYIVTKRFVPLLAACRNIGLAVIHAPAPKLAKSSPNWGKTP